MVNRGDAITELTAEHRAVERLFARFAELPIGDPRRREVADAFTVELVRHSVAEETVYPVLRSHVENGTRLADREIAGHARIEELLTNLEGLAADQEAFDALAARVVELVTEHVVDEETGIYPALAKACTAEQLTELGERIRASWTRPPVLQEPAVPGAPPLGAPPAPGAGLVGRAHALATGRSPA
jgi:hemerythrin superfamily protein